MPKHVLIVDDDDDDIEIICEALESIVEGIICAVAQVGADAIEMLCSSPDFDLVLMDINMPGLDGFSTLEQLKSIPRLNSLPVVIMSTSQTHETIARALKLGASSYFGKPASYSQWVEILKKYF